MSFKDIHIIVNEDRKEKREPMVNITSIPKDKYHIVYTTFVIGGIFLLLPWNMFITIQDYFVSYKLSEDYTGSKTNLVTYFLTYLGIVSQIPSLLFEYVNLFINFNGDLRKRIQAILIFQILLFTISAILAIVNTSHWPFIFFYLTMFTVFFINMATGIFQNSLYGLAVLLPVHYVGAVIIGTNISGIFTSLLSILIMSVSVSLPVLAISCFTTSALLLLILFSVLYYLPKNKFYRFYTKKNNAEKLPKLKFNEILKLGLNYIKHLFNIFFVFFITLACFPTILSYIKKTDDDFIVSDKFFTVITCFLMFNIATTIGSITAKYIKCPNENTLTCFIVLRIIFIPLFLLCNYIPPNTNRNLFIVIDNDYIYIFIVLLFGITSGHFSSLSFHYFVSSTKEKNVQASGMLGAISLITGIFTGLAFSSVFPYIIQNL
ncbi:hypothetical protein Yalta_007 [Yalta virus]|nr:hypothetical protein Yalta_007 [Yalta virus]